jgi:glycosyltransferase 2 family protein
VNTPTRTALVSLLAIALLGWFLSHANLAAVWQHVRAADPWMMGLGLVFVALTYISRTFRWQGLLKPLGPVRYKNAFRTTIIGFAALGLLPARAGDLLRPYMLARKEGLPVAATFATVVMERVLDLVAVLGLLAVYVFTSTEEMPETFRRPIEISAIIAAAGAVFLFVLMWVLASHPERVGTFVYATRRILPHRLAAKLSELTIAFSRGFAAARSPIVLLVGIIWSFPLWIFIAGEAWAITRAFDINMSFAGSFLVQAFLVIGVAVPTPGGVGSFHEMYRLAVTNFFHASNDSAVAAAIVVHAISFVPVVLYGLVLMAHDGLSVHQLQELAGEARDKEMPKSDEVPLLRSSGR